MNASELRVAIEQCLMCLRNLASGQGNRAVAAGVVSVLEMMGTCATATPDERQFSDGLAAAFRAFDDLCRVNPTLACHELDRSLLRLQQLMAQRP